MKSNEVVEELKLIRGGYPYPQTRTYQALTEAIRCVELLPELVEALEVYVGTAISCEDYDDVTKLIKKAKGEVTNGTI